MSEAVIKLRRDIQKYRDELKEMQAQRHKYEEANEDIVKRLSQCGSMERRNYEVALDTERALVESKAKVKDLEKEVLFTNRNRKDLELALHGVQEHNSMLERELGTLRSQLQGGTFSGVPSSLPTPTIASTLGTLAKMRPVSRERDLASQESAGRPFPSR